MENMKDTSILIYYNMEIFGIYIYKPDNFNTNIQTHFLIIDNLFEFPTCTNKFSQLSKKCFFNSDTQIQIIIRFGTTN